MAWKFNPFSGTLDYYDSTSSIPFENVNNSWANLFMLMGG